MKNLYLDLMETTLEAYTVEHIRKYTESVVQDGLSEHGFPRLTANLGILIAHGKKTELTDDFVRMMDLCCAEFPTAYEKKGWVAGNEFSVKEVVFCLLEVEKAGLFDKDVQSVRIDGEKIDFVFADGKIKFEKIMVCRSMEITV